MLFWTVKPLTQNPGLRRCEPIRIERIPLLASPQGGVAERLRRFRAASADRKAGVVFRLKTKGKPPRLRQLRWLREIFLMTQPPLLAVMQGGECAGSEISACEWGRTLPIHPLQPEL